jgi:hypothetical protein
MRKSVRWLAARKCRIEFEAFVKFVVKARWPEQVADWLVSMYKFYRDP